MFARPKGRATTPRWCAEKMTIITSTTSPRRADLGPEAVAEHKRITEEANKILYRGTDRRNPK